MSSPVQGKNANRRLGGAGVFGPHPRLENLIILAAVSPAYR